MSITDSLEEFGLEGPFLIDLSTVRPREVPFERSDSPRHCPAGVPHATQLAIGWHESRFGAEWIDVSRPY